MQHPKINRTKVLRWPTVRGTPIPTQNHQVFILMLKHKNFDVLFLPVDKYRTL